MVVEEINLLYTSKERAELLTEVSSELDDFFHWIMTRIFRRSRDAAQILAIKLFGPLTFTIRTLTLEEGLDVFPSNVEWQVTNLCRPLLVVDKLGRVAFRHPIIRVYLRYQSRAASPIINEKMSNKHLFLTCMRSLTTETPKSSFTYSKVEEFNERSGFWHYASEYWSHHLVSSGYDEETLSALECFLNDGFTEKWLHKLSSEKQLNVVVAAAQNFTYFTTAGTRQDPDTGYPFLTPSQQFYFQSWIDRLGKSFREHLGAFKPSLEWLKPLGSSPVSPDGRGHDDSRIAEARPVSISDAPIGLWGDPSPPGITDQSAKTIAASISGEGFDVASENTNLAREGPTAKAPETLKDDTESITSKEYDTQSEMSYRAPQNVAIEIQVGLLLGSSEELADLVKEALQGIPKGRLERNICRELKVLYAELRDEAGTNLERLLSWALRSRSGRARITTRALEEALSEADPDPDPHKELQESRRPQSYRRDRFDLEKRPSAVRFVAGGRREGYSALDGPAPEDMPRVAVWDSDGSSEDDVSEHEFPNISAAEEFIIGGRPFQAFLMNLALHSLPTTLRQVLEMAPTESIKFCDASNQSIADKVKMFLQVRTGSEWDWWPLSPARPPLLPDRIRMHWKCV